MTIVEVAFISGKLPNHLKHYKKPENITELRKLKKKVGVNVLDSFEGDGNNSIFRFSFL